MVQKKKHNTNNTSRRKRYNQRERLQNAKKWTEQNYEIILAKRYSHWFGVDLLCAITGQTKKVGKRKREKEQIDDFGEEMFYFVGEYTENGVPFGLTREEM